MDKLTELKIGIMKKLGYSAVEHIVYGARYVRSSTDSLFMTLKYFAVTGVEFFRRNTPTEVIDRYNMAFARQALARDRDTLYSHRTQWTWRFIE